MKSPISEVSRDTRKSKIDIKFGNMFLLPSLIRLDSYFYKMFMRNIEKK
jgi:hypothetical protein